MISRHLWLSLLMSASLFVVVFALAFSLASAAQAATWETHMDAGDKAYQQGNYIEAEKQVLAALKKAEAFGPQDPHLGIILNALADVYRSQGRYAEAKPLYKRALMIQEKTLGRTTRWWLRPSTIWRCSTMTRADTPRPSYFTSERSPFGRRPTGRRIPMWQIASTI